MTDRRTVVTVAAAAVLVIGGTLATGFLPPTLPYQLLAGGAIVAGFALVLVGLGEMPWNVEEDDDGDWERPK